MPGGNFVLDMQKAASDCKYTICVLSENYLNAKYTHSEWAAAFSKDPMGQERNLIPVRIQSCNLSGLLKTLTYVDLVDKSETEAEKLLIGAFSNRLKPDIKPGFPGQKHQATKTTHKVEFPGNINSHISKNESKKDVPFRNEKFKLLQKDIERLKKQEQYLSDDIDAVIEDLELPMLTGKDKRRLNTQKEKLEAEREEIIIRLEELCQSKQTCNMSICLRNLSIYILLKR